MYAVLIAGAVFAALPFYWAFVSGLKQPAEVLSLPIKWLPTNPRWENYVDAWNFLKPNLARAFLNSTVVTVGATFLMLFVSALTAYPLAKLKFAGRELLFKLILSLLLIPGFIGLISGVIIVKWLGWINTYWALIVTPVISAYTIFFLRQYMITIPDELMDAARIYGSSEFGIFWRIVFPLSRPALASIGLISMVFFWNDLLWPLVVIYTRDSYTVQLALAGLSDLRGYLPALHLVQAAAALSMVPLIVLTILATKYLIKGFTGLSYAKR